MRKFVHWVVLCLICVLVAGCAGAVSEEDRIAQVSADVDQLASVQRAVDEYKAQTGVLPIYNSDEYTDIYIKYRIDFSKLVPTYLLKTPMNAYEQGGLFQYVLWDVEEKPSVKLIDLTIPDLFRTIQTRSMGQSYPPFGEQLAPFVYTINYKKLGFDTPLTVQSPYTTNLLPVIVTGEGDLYIDYTLDIQQRITIYEGDLTSIKDARQLLIDDESIFLPGYSLPYSINGAEEVQFAYDAKESMMRKKQQRLKEYEQQSKNNE